MSARIFAAILLICSGLFAADFGDQAVALAKILAAKGTITAAELSTIESTPSPQQVAALAAMLQQKGVLMAAEGAQFGAAAAPATQSASVAATASTGPAQRTDLPVTTHTERSVALYGTLLMNAFYNTAPTKPSVTHFGLFTLIAFVIPLCYGGGFGNDAGVRGGLFRVARSRRDLRSDADRVGLWQRARSLADRANSRDHRAIR